MSETMFDPKAYVQKAIDHVQVRMERFYENEADAIAMTVIVFMIPYRVFIPAYYAQKGSVPEVHKRFLDPNCYI